MESIRFYTTAGCHLCDEAWQLLEPVAARRGLTVECVEIMDDTDAEAAYAESIPVIECPQRSRPLYWPFDMADLYRYLP